MALTEKETRLPAIMTDEQIKKLPPICRVIIGHDRAATQFFSVAVVPLAEFKTMRETRRGYTRDAARIYMPLSVRDGPQATV